ncbi:MAG: histidine kinase [Muribaculaceae bacterium]|nr:histidine kinase [Muribaculaceae bacterium]
MFILSVAIAVSIRMTYYNQETRRREIEISAERRKIELMGLKAQLNPHFLFNTLNNIYSLISISPERAQKAVHDLSTMLRYMIYETSSATVPLKREMSFIIDYIELMKLRLSKSFNLTVDINTNFVDDHQIAPLLFLTFIENAFKHSIKAGANAFISIHIYMKDDEVICEVANSFSDTSNEDKDDKGIGLQNVRQQLNMIYPDRHSLSIDSDNNVYKVTLKILLNK